jgi:chromosome segregation ATPase
MQVRKREEAIKGLQRKLAIREKRVREAEKKTKKRSDFLDAWEVSLKSKEAELIEERKEVESMKLNLRKLGEDIMALSDRADTMFEDIPIERDILEEVAMEEEPEDKKSFLGFLKGKPKMAEEPPIPKRRPTRAPSASGEKTLRELLEEKRDKLRSAPAEPSEPIGIEEAVEGETYECPVCGVEVSADAEMCHGCSVELTW